MYGSDVGKADGSGNKRQGVSGRKGDLRVCAYHHGTDGTSVDFGCASARIGHRVWKGICPSCRRICRYRRQCHEPAGFHGKGDGKDRAPEAGCTA